jgi:hypothetical protein
LVRRPEDILLSSIGSLGISMVDPKSGSSPQ